MSKLAQTVEQIQETQVALTRLERAIARHPETTSLSLSLKSLQKRQRVLETLFASLTNEQFVDICSYRLFTLQEGETPKLQGLTTALNSFQRLVTTVFDAVSNGPKQSGRTTAEANAATDFGFSYTFPGSVGFVLTLPNERVLVDESYLDIAISSIFEMAQSASSEQIQIWVAKLGAAPVKRVYEWANNHAQSGLGADITWRREEEVRFRLFAEAMQFEQLVRTIELTGGQSESEITFVGELLGIDVTRHTFHMRFDNEGEVFGKKAKLIDNEYVVPRRYTATLRKTVTINYSKEEDDVEYYLISLK